MHSFPQLTHDKKFSLPSGTVFWATLGVIERIFNITTICSNLNVFLHAGLLQYFLILYQPVPIHFLCSGWQQVLPVDWEWEADLASELHAPSHRVCCMRLWWGWFWVIWINHKNSAQCDELLSLHQEIIRFWISSLTWFIELRLWQAWGFPWTILSSGQNITKFTDNLAWKFPPTVRL